MSVVEDYVIMARDDERLLVNEKKSRPVTLRTIKADKFGCSRSHLNNFSKV